MFFQRCYVLEFLINCPDNPRKLLREVPEISSVNFFRSFSGISCRIFSENWSRNFFENSARNNSGDYFRNFINFFFRGSCKNSCRISFGISPVKPVEILLEIVPWILLRIFHEIYLQISLNNPPVVPMQVFLGSPGKIQSILRVKFSKQLLE